MRADASTIHEPLVRQTVEVIRGFSFGLCSAHSETMLSAHFAGLGIKTRTEIGQTDPTRAARSRKGDFALKRKRFSVEQIVTVLKQAEVGVPAALLIRRVGISEQTFYRWKKQFTGLEVDQVRQLKQLQEENARLKRLVADLTLDKMMLQDVLSKNTEALAAAPGG